MIIWKHFMQQQWVVFLPLCASKHSESYNFLGPGYVTIGERFFCYFKFVLVLGTIALCEACFHGQWSKAMFVGGDWWLNTDSPEIHEVVVLNVVGDSSNPASNSSTGSDSQPFKLCSQAPRPIPFQAICLRNHANNDWTKITVWHFINDFSTPHPTASLNIFFLPHHQQKQKLSKTAYFSP